MSVRWRLCCCLGVCVCLLYNVPLTEGQFSVMGSAQPIVAVAGDDVILPCHLEPALSAVDMTIEWARPDLIPIYVHLHQDGRTLNGLQNRAFNSRTALFVNELKNGNVSLKLSRVRRSDQGSYRCFLPLQNSEEKESFVQLIVGAVSIPEISMLKNPDSGVDLQCESGGWYPEPEMEWLDSEGHVLSAGPTEEINDPDGTFTVRRLVTVEKTATNKFTCRVQQQHINQTREKEIHIPDEVFQSSSSARDTGIGVSVAMVMLVLAGVVAFMFYRRKKAEHNEDLEKQRNEAKEEQEKLNLLAEAKIKEEGERRQVLEKEKKRKEEELKELADKKREAETKLHNQVTKKENELRGAQGQLEKKDEELRGTQEVLELTKTELRATQEMLQRTQGELRGKEEEIVRTQGELRGKEKELKGTPVEPRGKRKELMRKQGGLRGKEEELMATKQDLRGYKGELERTEEKLRTEQGMLRKKEEELRNTRGVLRQKEEALKTTQEELKGTKGNLVTTQGMLQTAQKDLKGKDIELGRAQEELTGYKELLGRTQEELTGYKGELGRTQEELSQTKKGLKETEEKLKEALNSLTQTQNELQLTHSEGGQLVQRLQHEMTVKDYELQKMKKGFAETDNQFQLACIEGQKLQTSLSEKKNDLQQALNPPKGTGKGGLQESGASHKQPMNSMSPMSRPAEDCSQEQGVEDIEANAETQTP